VIKAKAKDLEPRFRPKINSRPKPMCKGRIHKDTLPSTGGNFDRILHSVNIIS